MMRPEHGLERDAAEAAGHADLHEVRTEVRAPIGALCVGRAALFN